MSGRSSWATCRSARSTWGPSGGGQRGALRQGGRRLGGQDRGRAPPTSSAPWSTPRSRHGHVGRRRSRSTASRLQGAGARRRGAPGAPRRRDGGREAGAFALVLECIPPSSRARSGALSTRPSASARAPHCDGQVLVWHDLLGIEERIAPRFVRRYAEPGRAHARRRGASRGDVRSGPSRRARGLRDPSAPKPESLERLYGA